VPKGKEPSRIDIIGQNGNEGDHYDKDYGNHVSCYCIGPPNDCPCIRRKEGKPERRYPERTSWPDARYCSECSIRVDGVMGYVCSSSRCPIFPKAT